MRFLNDTGSVITVADLGQTVGPYEEFDWPDWSRKVHGVIPGCVLLDPEPEDDAAGENGTRETGGDPPKTPAADTGAARNGAGIKSAQASGTPPADTSQDAKPAKPAEENKA